jgi:hypothetical protein
LAAQPLREKAVAAVADREGLATFFRLPARPCQFDRDKGADFHSGKEEKEA